MQCVFRGSVYAHKYVMSPTSRRIESWWSFYRRSKSTWWINCFHDLVEREVFSPGNDFQMEALWCCFSSILQQDLDKVRNHWNTHRIRQSCHTSDPGIPDELFFTRIPWSTLVILPVPDDQIQYVADNLLSV